MLGTLDNVAYRMPGSKVRDACVVAFARLLALQILTAFNCCREEMPLGGAGAHTPLCSRLVEVNIQLPVTGVSRLILSMPGTVESSAHYNVITFFAGAHIHHLTFWNHLVPFSTLINVSRTTYCIITLGLQNLQN